MIHIQAPNDYTKHINSNIISMFLAGSIEMGKAEKWQDSFVDEIQEHNVLILNPRRSDWDSSWEQSIENDEFRKQVEWELQALEDADIILLYLQPGTKSPISILEFGIHAKANPEKLIVCCPDGFWRKGNIDITAKKYGVTVVSSKEEMIKIAKEKITAFAK